MRVFDWRQTEILADRYFFSLLGRLGSLALFLLQGPAIAAMIVVLWSGTKADARLELFLCIAALWVGTMNACREIVAERTIYRRERMVFLEIPSYVASKVLILGILDAAQAGLLLWIVHHYVGLPGNKLGLFLALWIGALIGTHLGLILSALVNRGDQAVAMVPLVILPQILFSRPFLPSGDLHGAVALCEKGMPLKWIGELYTEIVRLPKDPHLAELAWALLACGGILVALFGLVCFSLWFWDDE